MAAWVGEPMHQDRGNSNRTISDAIRLWSSRRKQPDIAGSEATRYLCAAMHQGSGFREHVIGYWIGLPWYGIELVAVACSRCRR